MPRAKKPKCLEKQVENTHGSEDMRHTKPSNFWSKRLQKKKREIPRRGRGKVSLVLIILKIFENWFLQHILSPKVYRKEFLDLKSLIFLKNKNKKQIYSWPLIVNTKEDEQSFQDVQLSERRYIYILLHKNWTYYKQKKQWTQTSSTCKDI